MKYEWDEEMDMLKLDRVLHGAAFYPHDYGFIPQTLCGDGDPLVCNRGPRHCNNEWSSRRRGEG